ncbi:MAG: hypothetical protein ACQPRJ_02245 [Solitalea-like symbiont of Acarus siro]
MKKILLKTLVILLIIVFASIITFKIPIVQEWSAQKIAELISEDLGVTIGVNKAYIKSLNNLSLTKVYINDKTGNKLIYADSINLDIKLLPIISRRLIINNIEINGAEFNLEELKDEKKLNLQFLIDYFSADANNKYKINKIEIKNLSLNNINFKFTNNNAQAIKELTKNNINYNDINISNLNLIAHDISINTLTDRINASIDSLSFKEKSGFKLDSLKSKLLYTSNNLEFTNLLLITPNSYIQDYASLSYNNPADFEDFLNKVSLKVNFTNSSVSFADIAFFTFALNGNRLTLDNVNGLINGPVNNLKTKRLQVDSHQAKFDAAIELNGLPNIYKTLVNINVNKLSISKASVSKILFDISKNLKPAIPKELDKFHEASLSGTITGKLLSFNTTGIITSKPGNLNIDINTEILPEQASFNYNGIFKSTEFNIGYIFNSKEFKNADFIASINGKDISENHAVLNTNLRLNKIDFRNYKYKNIIAAGSYNKGITNLKTKINDNNIQIQGNLELNAITQSLQINSNITNANINKLHLYKKNTLYVSAKIHSKLNYSKLDIDSIYGDIQVNNLYIDNKPQLSYDNDFVIDNIKINIDSGYNTNNKIFNLSSKLLDFKIQGSYDFNKIYKAISNIYNHHMSPEKALYYNYNQNFSFIVKIKDIAYLTDIFLPQLEIAPNTEITGVVNTQDQIFNFNFNSKQIKYNQNYISNLIINQTSSFNSLNVNIKSEGILIGKSYINSIKTDFNVKDYQAKWILDFAGKNPNNDHIYLNTLINFYESGFKLNFIDSKINIATNNWNFNKESSIVKLDDKIMFNNISLLSHEQSIIINGIASKNSKEIINIELKNVDAYKLTMIPNLLNINLKGIITGKASIASTLSLAKVNSNFNVKALEYNTIPLGEATFISSWNPIEESINLSGYVTKDNKTIANLIGKLMPNNSSNNIHVNLNLVNSPAYILATLIPDEVSEISGDLTGEVLIKVRILNPNITGSINLNNVAFKINSLNTKYLINETIELKDGSIIFNNNKITDTNGNKATIQGTIKIKKDITNPEVNLNVSANNFIVISPDIKQNYNFYGTILATGKITIKGSVKDLKIDGYLHSNEKSNLTMLVNNTSKSNENLITFTPFYKSDKQKSIRDDKKAPKNDISIKMLFDIDNNSELVLLLDPRTGEFIKVKGRGSINVNYNTKDENLQLYGLYTIDSGSYNFISGIISKLFTLAPKSTVSFSGDPFNTIINIKAIYTLYTPLENLYKEVKITEENSINQNRSVKVNTIIHIRGKIRDIESNFSIEFPNDSQLSSDIFGSYLANKDNITKQAISLIMTGNFVAGDLSTNTVNQFITDALYSTGADILFQQVKNIFTNIINIENIKFNAKITSYSQEIGSNISLFNNRLIIAGNVIAGSKPNNNEKDESLKRNSHGITGNIEIEYLVNKSGTIRLKVFNRSNDYLTSLFFNEALYAQGVGISYTRDFNSILQLFQK